MRKLFRMWNDTSKTVKNESKELNGEFGTEVWLCLLLVVLCLFHAFQVASFWISFGGFHNVMPAGEAYPNKQKP